MGQINRSLRHCPDVGCFDVIGSHVGDGGFNSFTTDRFGINKHL